MVLERVLVSDMPLVQSSATKSSRQQQQRTPFGQQSREPSPAALRRSLRDKSCSVFGTRDTGRAMGRAKRSIIFEFG